MGGPAARAHQVAARRFGIFFAFPDFDWSAVGYLQRPRPAGQEDRRGLNRRAVAGFALAIRTGSIPCRQQQREEKTAPKRRSNHEEKDADNSLAARNSRRRCPRDRLPRLRAAALRAGGSQRLAPPGVSEGKVQRRTVALSPATASLGCGSLSLPGAAKRPPGRNRGTRETLSPCHPHGESSRNVETTFAHSLPRARRAGPSLTPGRKKGLGLRLAPSRASPALTPLPLRRLRLYSRARRRVGGPTASSRLHPQERAADTAQATIAVSPSGSKPPFASSDERKRHLEPSGETRRQRKR